MERGVYAELVCLWRKASAMGVEWLSEGLHAYMHRTRHHFSTVIVVSSPSQPQYTYTDERNE